MKKKITFFLFFFLLIFSSASIAQKHIRFYDSAYKRNIIKWNITPFLIWGYKNLNFEYERALDPYRSFSMNLGYFTLPSFGIFDSLNISHTKKSYGFTFSSDYRFYINNKSNYTSPEGLFYGAYISFHHYQFQNNVSILNNENISGSFDWNGNLNITGIGVEAGYQYSFKKHWTVDIIFLAPSISLYNINMKLSGNINIDEEDEYIQALYNILKSILPGIDQLLTNGWSSKKGVNTSLGLGFRYLIQIGYKF